MGDVVYDTVSASVYLPSWPCRAFRGGRLSELELACSGKKSRDKKWDTPRVSEDGNGFLSVSELKLEPLAFSLSCP